MTNNERLYETDFFEQAVRAEISTKLVNLKSNVCPFAVRLVWHASGTFDQNDTSATRGGSNGATMRFDPELSDPANAGLHIMHDILQPVKDKYPDLSIADLWTLAGTQAIALTGGPVIPFKLGRTDVGPVVDVKDAGGSKGETAPVAPTTTTTTTTNTTTPPSTPPRLSSAPASPTTTSMLVKKCPPNGRLPDATQGAKHLREVFHRMGLDDRDIVALSGAHTLGSCHKTRSGFDGSWTTQPLKFDNEYFQNLVHLKWQPRHEVDEQWKQDGGENLLQYQATTSSGKKAMMLPTDLCLIEDKGFKKYVEQYAKDEALFFKDFATAFGKLLAKGCPDHCQPDYRNEDGKHASTSSSPASGLTPPPSPKGKKSRGWHPTSPRQSTEAVATTATPVDVNASFRDLSMHGSLERMKELVASVTATVAEGEALAVPKLKEETTAVTADDDMKKTGEQQEAGPFDGVAAAAAKEQEDKKEEGKDTATVGTAATTTTVGKIKEGCWFDLNATEPHSKRTALHKAAYFGHAHVIEYLTTLKLTTTKDDETIITINVNAQDADGDTPLHDAARFGHVTAVQALLQRKQPACAADAVDFTVRNNLKQLPIDVAAAYGKDKVVELLRQATVDEAANSESMTATGREAGGGVESKTKGPSTSSSSSAAQDESVSEIKDDFIMAVLFLMLAIMVAFAGELQRFMK